MLELFVAYKLYIAAAGLGVLTAAINAMSPPEQTTGRYAYCYRFLHGLPLPTAVGGHSIIPKL
jgi:hypothetical protein